MRDTLLRQFDLAWKLASYHLSGLSTAECLWRPAEIGYARFLYAARTAP